MNKDPYPIYQEALNFAIEQHGDQQYGDRPYEYHLRAVLAELEHANVNSQFTTEQFIAAACHDLIEDVGEVEQMRALLLARYGAVVESIVWACTGVGKNRKEKQASIVLKLQQEPLAIDVKLSDRICNMRNCMMTLNHGLLKMYKKEFGLYESTFKHGNPMLFDQFTKLSQ